jgi:fructose-1,6-bisphosphatase/inositol monophosphatase family enzyme
MVQSALLGDLREVCSDLITLAPTVRKAADAGFLKSKYPSIPVVCDVPETGSDYFLVDAEGVGSSLTFCADREPLVAAVSLTHSDVVYSAVSGGGSWKGSRQLRFCDDRRNVIVCSRFEWQLLGEKAHILFSNAGFTIRQKNTPLEALSELLEGEADVFIALDLRVSQLAAGAVLVKEAGGVALPLKGSNVDWSVNTPQCLLGTQREMTGGIRELIRRNFPT